jgi:hypothetical protein
VTCAATLSHSKNILISIVSHRSVFGQGGTKLKIEIPFSKDTLDQIHLVEAGGQITLKPKDVVVFTFNNQEQYDTYKKLKEGKR